MAIYMLVSTIPGSSSVPGECEGAIAIDNFSFSASAASPGSIPMGKCEGLDFGTPTFEEIRLSKAIDMASPLLLESVAKKDKIDDDIIIHFTRVKDKKVTTYLKITLSNCWFTDYDLSASGGEGSKPNENIALFYTKIDYCYTGADIGGADGNPNIISIDLTKSASE